MNDFNSDTRSKTYQEERLRCHSSSKRYRKALIFLHGFTGHRDETWADFPSLVGAQFPGWDIYTLGYATSLFPDVMGVWAADPDIPILSGMLGTQMQIEPLSRYGKISIAAHSMGGLIAQRAILDHEQLLRRLEHLFLFGTPSNGLVKAGLISFWKRSLSNMVSGGDFILKLRSDWHHRFGLKVPFKLHVVAGSQDQFVPPSSSLTPFHKTYHRIVTGNHLDIVKATKDSASLRLVTSALKTSRIPFIKNWKARENEALLAPFTPEGIEENAHFLKNSARNKDFAKAAVLLDGAGKRNEAIQLLEEQIHTTNDPDLKGTLAGRFKRSFMESLGPNFAESARDNYHEAFQQVTAEPEGTDHGQAYYHAINLAFLSLVAFHDQESLALEWAETALKHCQLEADSGAAPAYWRLATEAEAHLYNRENDRALELYVAAQELADEDWMLQSSWQQAAWVAAHYRDEDLADKLEAFFTPNADGIVNQIFVSYAHEDSDWVERLKVIMTPFLRDNHDRIKWWADREIEAGDAWNEKIDEALEKANIGVLLVSPDCLASEFITNRELPKLLEKDKKLLWIYLKHALYEQSPVANIQALHDLSQPLESLEVHQQNEILAEISRKIIEVALGGSGNG